MRLPLIDPADFDPLQKTLYDDMRAGIATGFNAFKTQQPDGKMIGPWNVSLHHPRPSRQARAGQYIPHQPDACP
ncbi:hypothetical protein [Gluconacetobacter tumulicola]|uniref:Uncharacterized protein n=1 Tax=Gluconacetobacter tumulicola TaxID=1017177 RepID=A0A7W4JFC2_9PROT|nr:hypothetical protein [Gluconacetobacter tumulicola]MBB2180232.1 hypothetical protein [Gluconacetobacter tumulicola]